MTSTFDPLNTDGPVGRDPLNTDSALHGRSTAEREDRHLFRKMAERGSLAGMRRLRHFLDQREDEQDEVYYVESNKSGDAPVGFDVAAQDSVEEAVRARLEQDRSGQSRQLVFAGEDVQQVARARPKNGTIVCRADSVDGSSQVRNTWMGAASVVIIEQWFGTWSRLEAISITGMTGMTISAENHTPQTPSVDRQQAWPSLRTPVGEVFFADHLTNRREQIEANRPARWRGSLAAVSYSRSRSSQLQPYIEAAWNQSTSRPDAPNKKVWGRFANMSGNPIIFGLGLGELEAVIEPGETSLHDSAFLAIHELLGGKVARLDNLDPLPFIETYQRLATNLDGKAKVIPAYIAYVGEDLPSWIESAHQVDTRFANVHRSGRHGLRS